MPEEMIRGGYLISDMKIASIDMRRYDRLRPGA